MISLTGWTKKDTLVIAIAALAVIIAVTYVSIILLDPYYGPCQYQYFSSGKCQDNKAWHIQQSISDEIHKIIR
jgi:hypothetical protein